MSLNNFPPISSRQNEISLLLAVLASVIEGRTAAYVSVPITSGKRFSEWRQRHNRDFDMSRSPDRDEHRREVIEPNLINARRILGEWRSKLVGVIIDPTALPDIRDWTQDDYRSFWACVIRRYVATAIFIDGWQYSNGCAYEFLVAQQTGIKTFTESGQLLTREEGRNLIASAIAEMRSSSAHTLFLEKVEAALTQILSVATDGTVTN